SGSLSEPPRGRRRKKHRHQAPAAPDVPDAILRDDAARRGHRLRDRVLQEEASRRWGGQWDGKSRARHAVALVLERDRVGMARTRAGSAKEAWREPGPNHRPYRHAMR